ncbi:MAG: hypothetical protein ACI9UK_000881 [Candidatus Krumholzibacteriia bacterium]|jgi:hypothetical protein
MVAITVLKRAPPATVKRISARETVSTNMEPEV